MTNHICNLCTSRRLPSTNHSSLGCMLDFPGPPFTFDYLGRILRYIRDNNIDLIHTHLYVADLVGGAIHALYPVPMVSSKYSLFPKKASPGTDDEILDSFYNIPPELSLCMHPDIILAASEAVRKSYVSAGVQKSRICTLRTFHLTRKNMESLYSGTLTHRKKANRRFTLTTISRLVPSKGLGDLIDAMRIVLHHSPQCRLVIVGSGPQKDALQRKAKSLGIGKSISFVGELSHQESLKQLQLSDAFVLATVDEALSLVIQEAMSAGVPVVATDVGGIRELIPSRKYGLLVDPGHPDELASAILHLQTDAERRVSVASHAHLRARDLFTVECSVEAHLRVYRRLLKSRSFVRQRPIGDGVHHD